MAQLPCISLYEPRIDLAFGNCTMDEWDQTLLDPKRPGSGLPPSCPSSGSISSLSSCQGTALPTSAKSINRWKFMVKMDTLLPEINNLAAENGWG